MDNETDYSELIEEARQGDRECRERLAEEARVRLRGYVLRLTMAEDLAGDIVQETILEMFKSFGKLRRTQSFWPWLYGIAFNKVRSHYGRKWRHKTVSLSDTGYDIRAKDGPDGLAEVVTAEWKQIVLKSMRQLEPRHRAVLAMRCYDQMKFAQIAKIIGCSELGVRALFYRAKKALAGKLAGNGLGKGSLLAGLILFGKMTATSEAAVANICVTSATLRVGALAAAAGIAATKTAILSLSAAAVVAVGGTLALAPKGDTAANGGPVSEAKASSVLPATAKANGGILECWYFFPEGPDGPVMTRGMKRQSAGKALYCQWLQDGRANYSFDNRRNTVCINNYRMWADDLSVLPLPTDSPQMSDFLSEIQPRQGRMQYVPDERSGLLVIATRDPDTGDDSPWAIRHYNVLDEEYFRYTWPAGVKIEDSRDEMHRRGWTYFRVAGDIAGQVVFGTGRVPFVYEASGQYWPWLRLDTGQTTLVDAGDGRLFKGLSRPWMGLHTIDTVRRDAAEQYVRFETNYKPGEAKAQIELAYESGKLIYTIDMEKDIVEKIVFSGDVAGEFRFTYLQDIEGVGDEFAEPGVGEYGNLYEEAGMLWLVQLAEGTLGK